jgi:hypothetical protein
MKGHAAELCAEGKKGARQADCERAGDPRPLRPPGHRHALPNRRPGHQRTRPSPPVPGEPPGRQADTGMHAPLGGACQAGKTPASAARPRPSVEKPTVRTDRPHGPDAVRYTSVDTATQRSAARQGDTPRDREETARIAAFPPVH